MGTLKELIGQGKRTDDGLEIHYGINNNEGEGPDNIMFISDAGISLIDSAPEEIQSLVDLVHAHSKLFSDSGETHDIDSFVYLGGNSEGGIYKVPIKAGLEVAVKLYFDFDEGDYLGDGGLAYYNALLKSKKDNCFDTLTPYLATGGYLFMSLLPDIPSYEDFVGLHPELEIEVKEALFNVQRMSEMWDVGFQIGGFDFNGDMFSELGDATHFEKFLFLETIIPEDLGPSNVSGVFVAEYDPKGTSLQEKYRFFIIDMHYS